MTFTRAAQMWAYIRISWIGVLLATMLALGLLPSCTPIHHETLLFAPNATRTPAP